MAGMTTPRRMAPADQCGRKKPPPWDEWVAERKTLLSREKELTRLSDQIAHERRALPWVRIDKTHTFDTPVGRRTLANLFDGRHQLLVQHFMLAPGWEQASRPDTSAG
jgi:predicted dithiol-disulfide oxidoreductase (DUF899 family)